MTDTRKPIAVVLDAERREALGEEPCFFEPKVITLMHSDLRVTEIVVDDDVVAIKCNWAGLRGGGGRRRSYTP